MENERKRVPLRNKNGIQDRMLGFLYKTKPGRVLLRWLIVPGVSKAAGYVMDCSPCDAKLSIYDITEDAVFYVKGTHYNIESLTKSKKLAQYYKGGTLCIFRLCVDDYHRYAYIDAGKQKRNYKIPGVLHTVNPIACGEFPVYKENSREFSVLYSKNFGNVLTMEVGAMMVGRIKNYKGETYALRGQEKGRFEYGGSTVILAFAKGEAIIDEEIINNSKYGFETLVKMGEVIGKKGPGNTEGGFLEDEYGYAHI